MNNRRIAIIPRQQKEARRTIHMIVAKRMFMAALIFSVLLCSAVYFNSREKAGSSVLDRAFIAAHFFSIRTAPLMSTPGSPNHQGLQEELDYLMSKRPYDPTGHLGKLGRVVYCELFFRDLQPVATAYDKHYPDIEEVKAIMAGWVRQLQGEKEYEFIRILGKPYIRLTAPVTGPEGAAVGHLAGIFSVSTKAIKAFRQKLIRTLLYMAAVIMATTALLYPIIMGLLSRISKLSMDLLESHLEILNVLGRVVAKRDSDTDAHNYRVTIFSVRLAEELTMPRKEIRGLIKGAFLHDVGKVGIPDRILHKPGPLSDEEFAVMRTHVDKGLNIVEGSDWLKDGLEVVGGHHEKVDGSGYPAGLTHDRMPLTARIFAIADVFDALTSERPYKSRISFDKTMQIMTKDTNNHFDPELMDQFHKIARPLHDRYANMESTTLKEDLKKIVSKYFVDDFVEILFEES